MIRTPLSLTGILTLAALPLLADFSYQEKSTVTGGALAGVLKVASVFSKQAREPIQTTISVKGDRMVTRGPNHATIIDLNNQTITSVELQKKSYSVMTFDQMKQMLEQTQQRLQNSKNSADAPSMNFKVSANNTGNSKQVNGYDAKELILKMEMEATDQQSGQTGGMVITTDMWIAPAIDGYGEVREFRKRMAEKLNWSPGGNMFAARPDVERGMAEVSKEIAKLDGMPVMQTIVMSGQGQATGQGQAGGQAQQPAERPSMGGLLGGAIGIQRTRKKSDQPADSQPGSLLEMTTELSGFSSSAVDDAQFTIPAGFKKLEPDMRRMQ